MKDSNNRTHVLPVGGVAVKSGLDLDIPATLYITSVDAGRKIEVSADGQGWGIPGVVATTATTVTYGIDYPIRAYRATGAAGDTYGAL